MRSLEHVGAAKCKIAVGEGWDKQDAFAILTITVPNDPLVHDVYILMAKKDSNVEEELTKTNVSILMWMEE